MGERMSKTPVSIFDLSYGDNGEAEQLRAAQSKCVRMFAGWRARLGVEDDAPVQRSYRFPVTGDTIHIQSVSSAEATIVHSTADGGQQEYRLAADGTVTAPDSDLMLTPYDYETCSRDLFDATNYQWAGGHEIV